jgi:hypothetical protein
VNFTKAPGHRTRQEIADAIPLALPFKIEKILGYYIGQKNALKMRRLLAELQAVGYPADARQVRAAIRELRREGALICSGASGYFFAASLMEAEDFIGGEIESRAHDLLETSRKMRAAAKREFGEGQQRELFST